ncbi:uncharacterized protein LOC144703271 isoform X2 [Wolffia australiana]
MDRARVYARPDMLEPFNRVDLLNSGGHHHSIPNAEIFTASNIENPLNNSAIWADINKHHCHDHHVQHHQPQHQSSVPNHGNVSGWRGTPFVDNTGILTKGQDSLEMDPREEMRNFYPQTETYMINGGAPGLMECPFGHHHHHHPHHHHPGYCQVHHGYYLPPSWAQYRVNPDGGFLSAWGHPATPCFPAAVQNPIGLDFGVNTSYGLPVSNLSLSVGIHADPLSRNSRHISSGANSRYYRSNRWLPQSIPGAPSAHLRISSAEGINEVAFPSFYGAENFFDRHSDLRLDIDGMSYEELLALGEQIGQVKIGLSREMLLKKLKTKVCSTVADNVPDTGSCIICQANFLEKEKIGTLDCGHEYHADCILEWLVVKNQCPVCKATAVPVDEKDR